MTAPRTSASRVRMSKPHDLTKIRCDTFASMLCRQGHAPGFVALSMIATGASAALKSQDAALVTTIREMLHSALLAIDEFRSLPSARAN